MFAHFKKVALSSSTFSLGLLLLLLNSGLDYGNMCVAVCIVTCSYIMCRAVYKHTRLQNDLGAILHDHRTSEFVVHVMQIAIYGIGLYLKKLNPETFAYLVATGQAVYNLANGLGQKLPGTAKTTLLMR